MAEMIVRVLDANDKPIADHTVIFTYEEGPKPLYVPPDDETNSSPEPPDRKKLKTDENGLVKVEFDLPEFLGLKVKVQTDLPNKGKVSKEVEIVSDKKKYELTFQDKAEKKNALERIKNHKAEVGLASALATATTYTVKRD